MHLQTSDQASLELGIGGHTCHWGTHFCGLYETEQERDEIVFGFLAKGCGDGSRMYYVPSERTHEDFYQKFPGACPHCIKDNKIPESLSLISAKSLYFPNGTFDALTMDDSLNSVYLSTMAEGWPHIRSMAEMTWALDAIPGVDQLMIYESRLNYLIPGKPWITICLYNITKFSGKTIMDVLRVHPYTITRNAILQNPYYQPPEEWLAENAPAYLARSHA